MRTPRGVLAMLVALAVSPLHAAPVAAVAEPDMSLFFDYRPGLTTFTQQTIDAFGGALNGGSLVCDSPRGPITLNFTSVNYYLSFTWGGSGSGQSTGPEDLAGGAGFVHYPDAGGTALVAGGDPVHAAVEEASVSGSVSVDYARVGTLLVATVGIDLAIASYGLFPATTCAPIALRMVAEGVPLSTSSWWFKGPATQAG